MMEASGAAANKYSQIGDDRVEAGLYQETGTPGMNDSSLPKPLNDTNVSADGTAKWILCGLLAWMYLWGNWANIEPVVTCEHSFSKPNRTVDCINDSAWLPQSFSLSLYFLMALCILTLLYRTTWPPLLLAILTILSIFQDWIFFGVYMPPANEFAESQSHHARSMIHFSQAAAVFTHLSKYILAVVGFRLFFRRGGTVTTISGARSTYQHMTSNGAPPAY